MDLSDADEVSAADPSAMLRAVAALPEHCRDGYSAGLATEGLPDGEGTVSVAFCGMGGSAVSGDVIRALYARRIGVPIEVVRSPVLPEFCETRTLVVCSSYSGNTAETLSCFEEAVRRGCRMLVVTSGGRLGARAAELGVSVVPVPAGFQPRAALGFLVFGSLGALQRAGLLPDAAHEVQETVDVLSALASGLVPGGADPRSREIAEAIGDRVPVIWGADGIGSVAAMRWKTQMNENAKSPAFWSSMSELDHNEVVGWAAGKGDGFFVVALRHPGEHSDTSPRFPLSLQIAEASGAPTQEVHSEGRSDLARLLSLVFVGDFTSVYLALLHGVDPTPVKVIEKLKADLARGG